MVTVNQRWDKFNDDLKLQVDGFDLNEQSRTHMTQITVQKVIRCFT